MIHEISPENEYLWGSGGEELPSERPSGGGRPLGHAAWGAPRVRCPPFKMKGRGLKWRPVVSLIHSGGFLGVGGGGGDGSVHCARFYLVPLGRGPGVVVFFWGLFFLVFFSTLKHALIKNPHSASATAAINMLD